MGDSPWHSDWRRAGDYRVLKIAFYLDPVDRDSGALRVIPGSHRLDGDRFARELEEHALADARRPLSRQRRRGPIVRPQPSMLTAEATATSSSIS